MARSTHTEIKTAYNAARQDVRSLLSTLLDQVANHEPEAAELHWGHVGDLGHLREQLKDLVEFME